MLKTYIFTFDTISEALRFEKVLKENEINVRLMPVPRKLSSSCGTCAKVEYEDDSILEIVNGMKLSFHENFLYQ